MSHLEIKKCSDIVHRKYHEAVVNQLQLEIEQLKKEARHFQSMINHWRELVMESYEIIKKLEEQPETKKDKTKGNNEYL